MPRQIHRIRSSAEEFHLTIFQQTRCDLNAGGAGSGVDIDGEAIATARTKPCTLLPTNQSGPDSTIVGALGQVSKVLAYLGVPWEIQT